MRYLLVLIVCFGCCIFVGCFCGGGLHYSKFQHYSVIRTSDTNHIEISDDGFSGFVRVTDAGYSQRWRYKYYLNLLIIFYNESKDTAFINKNCVSLRLKEDSFALNDDYTSIDEKGRFRYFKVFKLSNQIKFLLSRKY